ncbi:MAG: acetylglutamate kinase [Planctomycetia bacterium]
MGRKTFDAAIRKAETLVEALGYIRKFRHRLVVIKLGGSCLEHADSLEATLQDVVFMETVGVRPILVHGGGKAISEAMNNAGIQPRFIKGRRYTDPETLDIVAEVLTRTINADIVARIDKLGGWAMGMHYHSTNVLDGEKLELPDDDGAPIDLGRVGRVTKVDAPRLFKMCSAGMIPVIPSLACDADDELLNINADTAAAAVAEHLKAEKLVFISDTPGILLDRKDENSLAPSLSARDCRRLIADGVIDAGMIPKVEACLESLRAGVGKTHMIDGRVRHSLLLEIYTELGIGTEIVLER